MKPKWVISGSLLLALGLAGCAKEGPRTSTPSTPTDRSASASATSTDSSRSRSATGDVKAEERSSASSKVESTAAQRATSEAASASSDATTLTGCLSKGEAADTYLITDEKTGTKTQVAGTAELEKHSANHKVTLTGTRGSDNTFTATKIQHVAASCQAAAKP